jgi:hypothetical protein
MSATTRAPSAHPSAHPTIIPFPERNKGRKRKSTGPWSEGCCAMAQFECYPDNVAHIHQRRFDDVGALDLLASGFDTVVRQLPAETRKDIKRSAMITAAFDCDPRKQLIAAVFSAAFRNEDRRAMTAREGRE